LPTEVELALKNQAAKDGLPLEDYLASLVQDAQKRRERIDALAQKPFDEILAPFRAEVEASGMSDDELDALFTQARRAVAREKRERQTPGAAIYRS
jgi:hypothetical protein